MLCVCTGIFTVLYRWYNYNRVCQQRFYACRYKIDMGMRRDGSFDRPKFKESVQEYVCTDNVTSSLYAQLHTFSDISFFFFYFYSDRSFVPRRIGILPISNWRDVNMDNFGTGRRERPAVRPAPALRVVQDYSKWFIRFKNAIKWPLIHFFLSNRVPN